MKTELRLLFLITLAGILPAIETKTAAITITPLSQTASVSISGWTARSGQSQSYTDSQSVGDLGPSDTSVAGGGTGTDGTARSSAGLRLTMDATSITARGTATALAIGDNGPPPRATTHAEGQSVFRLLFTLDEPAAYSLAGRQNLTGDSTVFNHIFLFLMGPGAPIVDLHPLHPGRTGTHRDFSLTGILMPGTYQLAADATAVANGGRDSQNIAAQFDLSLVFSAVTDVPEAFSTAWLIAPVLGLMLIRRRSPAKGARRC